MTEKTFTVSGMHCAACQANVAKAVRKLDGVKSADVNLLTGQMRVGFDETRVTAQAIAGSVQAIGYGAELQGERAPDAMRSGWEQRQNAADAERAAMKRRLTASAVLLVPLMYLAMGGMLGLPLPACFSGEQNALILSFTQLLLTIPVLFLNRKFFTSGFRALKNRMPNMDSLVALGAGAAFVYGIFAIYRMLYGVSTQDAALVHQYRHALYFESSAMILTLVTVGKFLESRSKSKTGETLEKLVSLAPKTAVVLRDGQEVTVAAETIAVGDTVVIRPGERIPVDGIVTAGSGFVDQSAVTGESIPVEKQPGDSVISATINQNGSFRFTASRVGEETTLAQIIQMVDEAGSTKAPIARLADRISGIFVPVVIGIAVLTAVIWVLAGQGFEFALNRAVSVLVISCPCALGLATPVAIMVGTGKAAELGILIKSAEALEHLHSVNTVVLDKTGTVTEGRPSVTDILPFGISQTELLTLAAALEQGSEHPLAAAVTERAAQENLTLPIAEDFTAVPGRGVKARIGGVRYLGGNLAFLRENGVSTANASAAEQFAAQGKTPLLFAKETTLIGIIAAADTVRADSRAAVRAMRGAGIEVVLLTGDNARSAQAIAQAVGADQVIADVLPADKEAKLRALQSQGRRTAMIGDGINDAPALTRADVGIAIGAGTDIAVASADIVLIKSSLRDAVNAIHLSRAVIRNIKMNLFWAFFYNALGIPLAAGALYPAFGILLSPMIGALAMSLSSVCVVTNALRLRRFRVPEASIEHKEKGTMTMQKTMIIEGMMCEHCKSNVIKALSAVEGVAAVDVDLAQKRAAVTLQKPVADDVLRNAVTDAGYTVTQM